MPVTVPITCALLRSTERFHLRCRTATTTTHLDNHEAGGYPEDLAMTTPAGDNTEDGDNIDNDDNYED